MTRKDTTAPLLQTVNHELKMKLEEISRANNDLENLMSAADITMLFLDRNLGIKRYTAPLRQIFNVLNCVTTAAR